MEHTYLLKNECFFKINVTYSPILSPVAEADNIERKFATFLARDFPDISGYRYSNTRISTNSNMKPKKRRKKKQIMSSFYEVFIFTLFLFFWVSMNSGKIPYFVAIEHYCKDKNFFSIVFFYFFNTGWWLSSWSDIHSSNLTELLKLKMTDMKEGVGVGVNFFVFIVFVTMIPHMSNEYWVLLWVSSYGKPGTRLQAILQFRPLGDRD